MKASKAIDIPTTLHISEFGTFIGTSKDKIILKKDGKKLFHIPKNLCDRIIIASKGITLSSDLISLCSKNGIGIDFIECSKDPFSMAYASLYSAKFAYAKSFLKQLDILNSPRKIEFARAFVFGKVKNQLSYIKYLNKYRKTLTPFIDKIKQTIERVEKADTENSLMAIEANVSVQYWAAIREVIKEKVPSFEKRVTKGATDPFNMALNYGYAILYGRVRYHAVRASLALHISFLHTLNENKPTLIFDLIEEFRTAVVDRVIVSFINQGKKLILNENKRLDKDTRKMIAKGVIEKIHSFTKYEDSMMKIDTIISKQAYKLSRAIKKDIKYTPFIFKF